MGASSERAGAGDVAEQYSVLRGPFRPYFEGNLDRIPALSERKLTRLAPELGVRFYDNQTDEGVIDRSFVMWDFTIMRSDDGKARVLTGDLHIEADAPAEQVGQLLRDLVRLAHHLDAKLWHGFGEDKDECGIVTPEYIQAQIIGDQRANSSGDWTLPG